VLADLFKILNTETTCPKRLIVTYNKWPLIIIKNFNYVKKLTKKSIYTYKEFISSFSDETETTD